MTKILILFKENMNNRLQRLENIQITGPVLMETPLHQTEVQLLSELHPEQLEQITQGLLWQDC